MGILLYCTFLGFTVTFAIGAEKRNLGAYFASVVLGVLWVAGYLGFEAVLLQTPLPDIAAKAIAFGLMSFVIEAMNMLVTKKTPFRFIPLQFAVVIGVFSQQCQHIPYILAALVIGVFAAILSKSIYDKFLKTT
ncbi:MAG: hypothetical protein ACI4PH_11105 [Faecousia sp.]